MLDHVQTRLTKVEHKLAHNVLERDAYLLTMGESQCLQAMIENLKGIYRKHFNT